MKAKAFNNIDLCPTEGGETIVRIGGHIFDRVKMKFDFKEHHGLPNRSETKEAILLHLLEGANQHKINKIMEIMPAQEMLYMLLSYNDYKRLAELTEENLDSEPHNKVAFAESVVRDIIAPFGLSFQVTDSSLGVNININFSKNTYQLN